MAASIEFVRIAGYPVKVTSLAHDHASGSITLVVITRGSSDRNHLNDLLAESPLTLEVPEEPSRAVDVEEVDARSVGEGEQAITRFSVRFAPADSAQDVPEEEPEARSLEDRLESIERKLDLVLKELAQSRKARRVDPE
jgi:hypothetical protein